MHQAIAPKGGKSLLPRDVRTLVLEALADQSFRIPCEPKYIDTVQSFVDDKIVAGMVKLREKYEMFGAGEEAEELDGREDLAAGGKS